jgi:hypothetical protein
MSGGRSITDEVRKNSDDARSNHNNQQHNDRSRSGLPLPLLNHLPSEGSASVSEAAKGVLEVLEPEDDELTYKISLMESLFQDMEQGQPSLEATQQTQKKQKQNTTNKPLDLEGDAKIPAKRRRQSNKVIKAPDPPGETPRQVDRSLSRGKEKGQVACDPEHQEASGLTYPSTAMSQSHRFSKQYLDSISEMFEADGNEKKRCRLCLLMVLFFTIAVGIVILLGILFAEGARSDSDDAFDKNVPTASPTSFTYDVLPDYTQNALRDPASPHARAYYWLEEDRRRSFLSAKEALQRFVLGVFYYSTRGDLEWIRNES